MSQAAVIEALRDRLPNYRQVARGLDRVSVAEATLYFQSVDFQQKALLRLVEQYSDKKADKLVALNEKHKLGPSALMQRLHSHLPPEDRNGVPSSTMLRLHGLNSLVKSALDARRCEERTKTLHYLIQNNHDFEQIVTMVLELMNEHGYLKEPRKVMRGRQYLEEMTLEISFLG